VDEHVLVYVNDFLCTGNIPELFVAEEKEKILNNSDFIHEVKQEGVLDAWEYFIQKARKHLRIIMCFSPTGDVLRQRCRKFPALINHTTIDWFHPWQYEPMVTVASKYLNDFEVGGIDTRENAAHFMAHVHASMEMISAEYRQVGKRYNYTTPRNFTDMISIYRDLLSTKREELSNKRLRLQQAIDRLDQTESTAKELDKQLRTQKSQMQATLVKADEVIAEIGRENGALEEKQQQASEERRRVALKQREAIDFQTSCQQELEQATPLLENAEKALSSLDNKSIGEFKSLTKPADEAQSVAFVIMILYQGATQRDLNWTNAKKMMQQVIRFLKDLRTIDPREIPTERVQAALPYVTKDYFNPDDMFKYSTTASLLCAWACNIVKYHTIYQRVKLLEEKTARAEKEQAEANERLHVAEEILTEMEKKVRDLKSQYVQCVKDKIRLQSEIEVTERLVKNSERLMNSLSGYRTSWKDQLEILDRQSVLLGGDVLLASACISYLGAFTQDFRLKLMKQWTKDLSTRMIPFTEKASPQDILSTEAERAKWSNEGLPTDEQSLENGYIVIHSKRCPLLIDPQQQGAAWIKQHEAANGIKVLQKQQDYETVLKEAMEKGEVVLIENIDEDIDQGLVPLLARACTHVATSKTNSKHSRKSSLVHKDFRLYLQIRLPNPTFRPEVFSYTTVVYSGVTESGLETQLLAIVVKHERKDLEQSIEKLQRDQNDSRIQLSELEDTLIQRLSTEQTDLLDNEELISSMSDARLSIEKVSHHNNIIHVIIPFIRL